VGGGGEGRKDRMTTIKSVQINGLSVGEALSDSDEKGRLTEESHVPVPSHLRLRTRQVKQLKVPLTSAPSLRPRRNAKPTQPEQLPGVSMVISARGTDELVARTIVLLEDSVALTQSVQYLESPWSVRTSLWYPAQTIRTSFGLN
jgi:hypothetical protein